MPANFNVGNKFLDGPPALIDTLKEIGAMGFEFGGSYDNGPFWDVSYDGQYEAMARLKDSVEALTGKRMRLFSSKFSAYNEDTLRIAEKIGVDYLFGRGVSGVLASVYKPEEFNVKIISTSDVIFADSSGTLGDGPLWTRGATPEDFHGVLFNLREERITLVAQSQLSGVKQRWWQCYMDLFDAGTVMWRDVDSFAKDYIVLPAANIPINRTVEYNDTKPAIPLDQELDI
jgi:hypothetical protein